MLNDVLQGELDKMFGQLSAQNTPAPQPTGEPAPAAPVTNVVTPAAEPVAKPTEPVAQVTPQVAPLDLDAIVNDWDTVQVTPKPIPQTTPTTQFSLSEVAKALNVEKEAEVMAVIEKYKQTSEGLTKAPEDLRKALEIAMNGGNYLEYLNIGVVDWSKEDPITLYENYVIDMYTDPVTKTVNEEALDKILDNIPDQDKELRGRELQRQYLSFQAQRKQAMEQEASSKRQKFEQNLRQAVDSIDNIAGFKLTPAHKTELFNYVLSGQDLKADDLQTRVVDAGLKKYWSKMDNFRKDQIKNATQRSMLNDTTFPKLNATSTPANIDDKPSKYGVADYIKELEKQRGFSVPQ